MSREKLIYFLLLSTFIQPLFAQKNNDPRVKKISRVYFELQDNIKADKYHQNQFQMNANDLQQHSSLEGFDDKYHTLDEQYNYELDKDGKAVLRNVYVFATLKLNESVTVESQGDFMFDTEGKLIYHLQIQKLRGEKETHQNQFFYENEKIIQLHLDVKILEENNFEEGHRKMAEEIQREATNYWNKFYQQQLPEMEALMDF